MRKIFPLFFLVMPVMVCLSIISCESSKASASRMLKFNLEKGKGYDYQMVWDFNQDIMGQDMKMGMGMGYTLEVTENDSMVRTIDAAINHLQWNMNLMGMNLHIDTDKPMAENEVPENEKKLSAAFNKVMSSVKGKKFTMKVDPEGKVLEVNGFEDIFLSMIDSSGADVAEKEKATESLRQQFNSQETKDQFVELFYIFPQREVKVGDSWEKNYETGGKVPAKNHTVYKVKDIDGDMVTLSSQTELESLDDKLKITGTKKGKLLVDSRTGLVIDATFDHEINFSAMGMSFTMKGKGKIKGAAK
jgi:hypothetical protein